MTLNGVRVLMVEDDQVFSQLVSDYCHKQGMVVETATDGKTGLARFRRFKPDLLLVDLNMPNMDGYEMLEFIAEHASQVPSIVVTANKEMSGVVRALRHGAWDYLMKPLNDLTLLRHAMEDCLRDVGTYGMQIPESVLQHPKQTVEMADHLEAFQGDLQTAQLVQEQLYPEAEVLSKGYQFGFNLFRSGSISDHCIDGFECGPDHFVAYLAKITPGSYDSAFVSVLVRSFFNQKIKRFRKGASTVILQPKAMLDYLNEQLVKSGLGASLDIIYLVLDTRSNDLAIARAGAQVKPYLRAGDHLSPIMVPESLPIGRATWASAIEHHRTLQQGQAMVMSEGTSGPRTLLLESRFVGVSEQNQVGASVQLKVV